ncbi:XylR N-terminal domain-containing protein [Bacillus sp. EB600]|uniref:XylR N-terminal domain-containing protein n=1 Tax=Bacillus sp. EB600 TaxID=2806345 RepID=UPI00210E4D72|nr:XylR N-terminal domain-containing protein [Bacillus sp. EB600]MCQ6282287.1 XylR N-terminal domain-containing protein [Bacillus sp. EB600]
MKSENMGTEQLELNQVYNNLYGKNLDGFQNERVITIPANAIGRLSKELIETMGVERTKGFLLRYGWNCGVSDALNMIDIYGVKEETVALGPKIHSLHGYQEDNQIEKLEVDFIKGTLNLEGFWTNSYEALEHIKLFGVSNQPVCHTLTGLASGYLSTILGEKVILKEIECQGMGHKYCRVVCRTVKEWNGEVDHELRYYEMESLIHELNQTYEQLKNERDNLNKSFSIHEKLMKEIHRDNSLSSQLKLLNQITKRPAFIKDVDDNVLAVAGISEDDIFSIKIPGFIKVNKTEFIQTNDDNGILITPIYLNQKIVAFYSLFYEKTKPQELDKMIIERASLTSSLSLLNERIRFQSEQRVKGSFLEDILSGTMKIEEITKRAYYLGLKLNPSYSIIAFKSKDQSSLIEELEFNEELMNHIDRYFKDHKINVLIGQKSENIIILLSGNQLLKNQRSNQLLCKKLYNHILIKYPKNRFEFGISSISNTLDDIGQLYEESLVSLKIANKSRNIVSYDALGIEGILFQMNNQKNVQKLIRKKMGKLMEEDKLKNWELMKTLYIYLNTGCNVLKTARLMNFSVSGLRYRLDRINEILETDIKKPSISYQIFMVLQFLILSGEVDIDIEMDMDMEGEELDIE